MKKRIVVACLSTFSLALGGFALAAPVSATTPVTSEPSATAAERALRAAASGPVRISRGTDGVAKFVGTTAGKPVSRPAGLKAGAAPETVARAHLSRYGSLFGVSDQSRQLRRDRVTRGAANQQIVRFSQLMAGLPVLGGELVVALDADGRLLSVNGETARSAGTTSFATPRARATTTAIGSAAKANRVSAAHLRAATPQQWMYDASLVGPGRQTGARSVWRVEVRATNGAPVRQLVLVDGTTGAVALSFNQIADARDRRVCDFNNVPDTDYACLPPPYARTELQGPTAVADVNLAFDYSGDTYDFFFTEFGRDSFDDAGAPLISAVRACPDDPADCPYGNAFWDGAQMTYGQGFASADDVVAHELAHGVTEYTSNLLYYYQSGAINESMSDVFGEFVDLTNGAGTDTAGVRWKLGEDLPAAVGVIRDMKNPPAFEQPDKTSSPLWNSDWYDAGGVHYNSGVGNKAAYLMTDGGTFNGTTVTALGIPKVAAVYYEALQMLTSGSDYVDLYFILQQACNSLVGGPKGITAANCLQVENAVDAVEMSVYPDNDPPLPAPPATCDGTDVTRFSDNFNGTLTDKWTLNGPWSTNTTYQRNVAAGKQLFGPDPSGVSDISITTTQSILVPYARATYLRFDHAYSFDWIGPDPAGEAPTAYYDGGFVEASTNNGATWTTISVQANGYNAVLEPPLNRSAFSGDSTDWITSQATLSQFAGKSVKLRLRIVTDGFAADSTAYGWWIDNLSVYQCAPRPRADYNGEGQADRAVFRPATGTWDIDGSAPTVYGRNGDVPLAGDFTSDGKSDLAVYRPSTGQWHIKGLSTVNYGNSADKAVPADYTGDGRADVAIWRPSNGTWNVRGIPGAVAYGVNGDIPVPADFTGDGKADFAVFRPSTGTWYVRGMSSVRFGQSGDRPTVGDFTGDGKADIALWRPSTGRWYVRGVTSPIWGLSTDVPVAGDFTGDGRADIAIWRPSTGTWWVRNVFTTQHGQAGDVPLFG